MIMGIKRTIDPLGRVVIPKEIRRDFNIIDGETEIAIAVEEGAIVLRVAGNQPKTLDQAIAIIESEMKKSADSVGMDSINYIKNQMKRAIENGEKGMYV